MERIRVAGGELTGESTGSGEPVLCIHGSIMADTYDCLRGQPALAGHRLISYRRRGFVDSVAHDGPFSIEQQAADARAVLQHFGVARAHVVGHSYGGCTALQLALDAPEVVHSLGLLEPGVMQVPAAEGFAADAGAVAELYAAGDVKDAIARFIDLVGGAAAQAALDATLAPGWFDQAVADADTFFQIEFPALGAWTFGPAEAARVTQPCLAVVGSDSSELFQQITGWLEQHLSAVSTFRLPRATHVLQVMNPSDFAEGLGAFLAAHPM
jgi:pimeloyl-ACP methyl ester carboxylesterase